MYGIEISVGNINSEWEEGELRTVIVHSECVSEPVKLCEDGLFEVLVKCGFEPALINIFPDECYGIRALSHEDFATVVSACESVYYKSEVSEWIREFLFWFKNAISEALSIYTTPGITWY